MLESIFKDGKWQTNFLESRKSHVWYILQKVRGMEISFTFVSFLKYWTHSKVKKRKGNLQKEASGLERRLLCYFLRAPDGDCGGGEWALNPSPSAQALAAG